MRHRLSLNILASICSFAEIEVQPRKFSFIKKKKKIKEMLFSLQTNHFKTSGFEDVPIFV